MLRALLGLGLFVHSGCDGCNNDGSRHIIDSPGAFADARDARDAATFDASNPNSVVFVTVSPAGPGNGDESTWSGVLQFSVNGDGSPLVAETGIDKAALADPVSVEFKSSTSELFVSNRHGNNSADGIAGSISRYHYDQATHSLAAEPALTGNGLSGVHQAVFNPVTGELFAANVNDAISRFTFAADGTPVANGVISNGPTRGVFVAPDGKRLYQTTAGNVIRQFDLATSTELAAITLTSSGNLHFFAYRLGDVYVAALDDQMVYRYHLGATDDLTYVQAIACASPIGIAFSADGGEMYVTGHRTSDILQRFSYDAATDTWLPEGTMDLGASLGGVVVLPG